MLLEVKELCKEFGGLMAVDHLDVAVEQGEILGLIGPNGAGKTTFFNVISGFLRPTSGKVWFNGEDISGLSPSKIARKRLVRTFQANSLFDDKTVIENLILAHHLYAKAGILRALLNAPAYRRQEREIINRSLDILKLLNFTGSEDELAHNLPHGHQRALGVAMALAADPLLLLLDEPATGLNPNEAINFMSTIDKITQSGITIILVEHDMKTVMNVCQRLVVLNYGKKIAEGSCEDIRSNEKVIEAYLGRE
jgi:branched-chain amino acid transport system ATP-binding protein